VRDADGHVSDIDLMLALDGELAADQAAGVEQHLAHCWPCRARRAELDRGVAVYMGLHGDLAAPAPDAGAAALLRARIRQEESRRRATRLWGWHGVRPPVLAGSAALLVAVIWFGAAGVKAGPLPDSQLTPGAVRLISSQQACGVAPEDEGRLVPADLARRVFEQYRIRDPKPGSYEVDYLISPALGGATALQNLWPVPYAEGVWTSRVKDALEDHLRGLVCAGRIDLGEAQRELSTNWIECYRKHFRTRRPLVQHMRFVKDSPWE